MTGGPEALHQLALGLNEQGVATEIAYYSTSPKIAPFKLSRGLLEVRPVLDNPCPLAFSQYRSVAARRVALDPKLLVVLPEPLGHTRVHFAPAQVAVWWLAVDSAIDPVTKRPKDWCRHAGLDDPRVLQLYQSAYARTFL
ncbi:MAG: hypothetical protein KY449_03710, partial [Proteobacteria bacterium]|nr:hypothetical protein [Pseudomonadota bacterium]